MKKMRIAGLMAGLIILFTANARAQYYYTTYGYAQEWQLPSHVEHIIYNDYYGYEVAHVERHRHYEYTNFDVLLYRNGLYLEVRFDRFGTVYKTVSYNNFPLRAHECTGHCGYHRVFYNQTFYPQYGAYYHHGHNTTVYVTNTDPYYHYNTGHVNNNYTTVYVQPQGNKHYNNGNANNNNGHNNNQYNNGNNNYNQPRTNEGIRKPVVTNNVEHRNTAPAIRGERVEQARPQGNPQARESVSYSGRNTGTRGTSGRGNK